MPLAVPGIKRNLPSSPSLANEACVARETRTATPSTSTSTACNSERIKGSSYRTDENLNVDSDLPSASEPDLALHNIFHHSQSSVTNDIWEESAAVNCKGEEVCSVCKIKPPAVKLTVKPLACSVFCF